MKIDYPIREGPCPPLPLPLPPPPRLPPRPPSPCDATGAASMPALLVSGPAAVDDTIGVKASLLFSPRFCSPVVTPTPLRAASKCLKPNPSLPRFVSTAAFDVASSGASRAEGAAVVVGNTPWWTASLEAFAACLLRLERIDTGGVGLTSGDETVFPTAWEEFRLNFVWFCWTGLEDDGVTAGSFFVFFTVAASARVVFFKELPGGFGTVNISL